MQLASKDNRVIIVLCDDPTKNAILPQADFSLIEVPVELSASERLYQQLYKTQRSNHVSLNTIRLPKRMRLKAFSNLLKAEEAGFRYHDHITLLSQEEYKSIPSNLTQLGETAVLLTKSEEINKKATEWFRPDVGDCSNVWDLTPQQDESSINKTVSRHFCWELGILLAGCASPLICRRFLVIGLPETGMTEFAFKWNLQMYCITTDEISARRVIKAYHKFLEKQEGKSDGKGN